MTSSAEFDHPKISVVMPSFNQAVYLEEAIRSVLEQGYPNIELIVIDGGSTDGSVEIMRRHSNIIAYQESAPDGGQSEALNKGIQRVTGDIVGWLNSDDTYAPGTLHQVAQVFESVDVNIAMCRTFGLMDAEGQVYDHKENTYSGHDTLVRYWSTRGMTINQPSVFFRTSLLDEFSFEFDTRLEYAMDYDLWLRITTRYPIHVVDGYWANYRFHDESKSGTGFGKFFAEWYAVSQRYWGPKFSPKWWQYRFSHAWHYYGLRPAIGAIRRARGGT